MPPDDEIVATEQPTLEPPPAPPVEAPPPAEPALPAEPDKPRSPLDFIEERAKLSRAKMEAGHQDLFPKPTPPPAIEAAPTEMPAAPPAAETSPAAVPTPAQPAQAAQPTPAPATPAPTPTEQKKPPFGENWGEYRKILKSIKAIEAAGGRVEDLLSRPAAAPAATPPPAAVVPTSDDDPFGVNKVAADVQAIKDGQAALRAQQDAIQREAVINQQIRVFEAEHPDYRPALDYLVKSRQDEYRMSHMADSDAVGMLANPQWAPAIEKAQDILSERRQAYVTEEEAAIELAIELRVNAEANGIINGTLRQGKAVPPVVYELAKQRGYQTAPLMPPLVPAAAPNGTASATAPATPVPSPVAERIRAEARKTAAAKSLSNVASATATGGAMPTPIRTLQDLADFRGRVGPQEYQAFIRAQNDRDPRWHLKLTTG